MKSENKKVLIFVEDIYEDLELNYPKYRLIEAGAKVVVAGPEQGKIYKGKHGLPCKADISFDAVNVKEYHALIIPGGFAPDKLRAIPKVLEITKQFNTEKKLIAFICHAGWVPISAGIIDGVTCTSYHTIKDDLINAGAKWTDKEVVVDGHIISSRCPDDLPAFCKSILELLK